MRVCVYENRHVFDGARPEFPHHFLQREQENRVSGTQQEEEEEWEEIRWIWSLFFYFIFYFEIIL